MGQIVDSRTLEAWQRLDVLFVLDRLGCYAKCDSSFFPLRAKGTKRYHVNANGRDWELLITGAKFWDARAKRGGGGAVDLAIHLFNIDFKRALLMLRKLQLDAPATESSPEL